MAKRFYICPILAPSGSGVNSDYRAAVGDVSGASHYAVIPTFSSGPNIGKPLYNFAFGMVAHSNMALVGQTLNTLIFPDFPLDATLDGMDAETRTGLKASIEAYRLDANNTRLNASIVLNDAASYRDLVDSIGSQIQPGWQSRLVAEPLEVA
jgi:hypothetical protein